MQKNITVTSKISTLLQFVNYVERATILRRSYVNHSIFGKIDRLNKNKRHHVFPYKAGISFWLLISFATPGQAACPLKITTTQQLIGEYPGWASFRNEVIHFAEGVSFYSGPPEEQAVLKPDSSAQGKARWTFSSRDTIYMVCEYHQTIIHLSKKLPPDTTTCEVRYDPSTHGANGPIPTAIICH